MISTYVDYYLGKWYIRLPANILYQVQSPVSTHLEYHFHIVKSKNCNNNISKHEPWQWSGLCLWYRIIQTYISRFRLKKIVMQIIRGVAEKYFVLLISVICVVFPQLSRSGFAFTIWVEIIRMGTRHFSFHVSSVSKMTRSQNDPTESQTKHSQLLSSLKRVMAFPVLIVCWLKVTQLTINGLWKGKQNIYIVSPLFTTSI